MKRDAEKIPPFPVINLHVDEDGQVHVDGRPVAVPAGITPAQAGVAAVARLASEQGLEAVRVRAVAPEGEFTMAVWDDGEAVDTTPTPPAAAQPRRRAVLLWVATASALVLAGTGTVAVVALTGSEPEPVASAPVTPGAGANLPVQAPAGFGQAATWSVPVDDRSPALPTADGRLVVTTPDGMIKSLDGATGAVVWMGRDPQANLHLSHIGERPVVAASSTRTLYLWPMDMTDPAGVPPVELAIDSRAEVTYQGSMPLIELDNQTVAMFDGDQLTYRDVPVGASPVMATPDGVIAVGQDDWWRITTTEDPVPTRLPRPTAATGAPERALAASDEQLLVAWPTNDRVTSVLALIDLNTSTIRTELTIPSRALGREDDAPLHDPDDTTMTVGSILIDHGPEPLIAHLGEIGEIVPSALDGRTIYGTASRKPIAIRWDDSAHVLPLPEVPGDVVPPAAVTTQHAYVVTEKVTQTLLYALPRTEGTNP